jgi:hypothetical protein
MDRAVTLPLWQADKNFIRKLVRGLPVKRNSYDEFLLWLRSFKLSQK